jgi:hypothetical protein
MLGSVKVEGQWSVLLMDNVTTQIMTNICGVSDLLDYGISRKYLLGQFDLSITLPPPKIFFQKPF